MHWSREFDPAAVLQLIERHRVTVFEGVPTDDYVLHAVDNEVEAVVVAGGHVAGVEPAVDDCCFGGVNLRGFFEVTRAGIAAMESHGDGGHVVTISTSLIDHALSQVPSVLASLTKGGLNAATRSLAIEYAARGIRSNAVALGIIRTPMHPPETHEFLDALHPVGHMGDIEDVVHGVLYLEQAKFVTGEILHVDGGQSAGH